MSIPAGIDDLNVYAGTLVLEAAELARGRGTRPQELAKLLLLRRSVLPAFEDPVTLAVNAALPVVDSAGRSNIRLLLVATESGVDDAKPLSSYVHEQLRLPSSCRHVELKHACYAGTAALRLACGFVRDHPGMQALVICTDMARKLFGDPAEAAEGVGATAMLVGKEPRVLTIEGPAGVAAREIYDVMRPTRTAEVIHSALSLAGYLDLLEESWPDYRKQPGALAFRDFAALAFHTPLVPLVQQAHRLLFELADPDRPSTSSVLSLSKGSGRTEVDADFERRVLPSTRFCQQIGNTYSGCLYVALAALADGAASLTQAQDIGLYSYGSGSCAEFFHGRLQPGASARVRRHAIAENLAARRSVSFAEYEALVLSTEASMSRADHEPGRDLVDGLFEQHYAGKNRLVLRGVRDHHRTYQWS